MTERRPLRVHVCIDQELSDAPQSGLLRTWEQLWQAAAEEPSLDLTTHLLGPHRSTHPLSPNVRVEQYPLPKLSSRTIERWGLPIPARVGLLPMRASLARQLAQAELIHTTYTLFSFAMTGLWVSRWRGIPLVSSLQTLVPQHAELYTQAMMDRLGSPALRRWLHRRQLPSRVRQALAAQARWYFAHCQRVLVSSEDDAHSLPQSMPAERIVRWGRGIDHQRFRPQARDRRFLQRRYGIPLEVPVLLYVGKLRREKNIQLLAEALQLLRDGAPPFRVLVCGTGDQATVLEQRLGPALVLAGRVEHSELPRLYASSDLLVFPSATESFGQVVMEARCCGLVPVVSRRGGARQHVLHPGWDGYLVSEDTPEAWAKVLRESLLHLHALRARRPQVRQLAVDQYPSWNELFVSVFRLWREVAAGARRGKALGA